MTWRDGGNLKRIKFIFNVRNSESLYIPFVMQMQYRTGVLITRSIIRETSATSETFTIPGVRVIKIAPWLKSRIIIATFLSLFFPSLSVRVLLDSPMRLITNNAEPCTLRCLIARCARIFRFSRMSPSNVNKKNFSRLPRQLWIISFNE